MKIELFTNGTDNFPWGWLVLWGIVWLLVLHRILTREDFDTLTKILWTMVVIFVPIFGVILYAVAAPATADSISHRKGGENLPLSDVSGTPWASNPGFTKDK